MEEMSSDNKEIYNYGDFLLYIRDKYYEKGENNTKKVWYSGYLALIDFTYKKGKDTNKYNYIHDINLFDILNGNSSNFSLQNNNNSASSIFIKIDFYENGDIKNIYYPKSGNFSVRTMDIFNDVARLIIPKISADLFSENIQDHLNDLLKDKENDDNNFNNSRASLLRRLSEISKKNNDNKRTANELKRIRKIKYRVLKENSDENETEMVLEQEILPTKPEIDINLRQINKSSDNSSELLLLSLQDVISDKAKLSGSLNNKTVHTNLSDEGLVTSIKENSQALFVNGTGDGAEDELIYNSLYSEDSQFKKEDMQFENETTPSGDLGFKNLSLDTVNSIEFLYDYMDENGSLIEYFSNVEYEEYNDSIYENELLNEIGKEYLDSINASNRTIISIEDSIVNETARLRNLLMRYPYYGQYISNNVQTIYNETVLGLEIKAYSVTYVYPDDGRYISNDILLAGLFKIKVHGNVSYSNNHIIIKNLNCLGNDLIELINEDIEYLKEYKFEFSNTLSNYISNISGNLVGKDYPDTFSDFIDHVKDFSNFSDTFNIIYDKFTELDKKITNFMKDFTEDKVETFLNIRKSIKNEYLDYFNLLINKVESFKQEFLIFISKFKDEINNEKEIKNIQILYDLRKTIDENKYVLKNFVPTLFDKVSLKAEYYFNEFDPENSYKSYFDTNADQLLETIQYVSNEFLLTKKNEIISELKKMKEYKSNISSMFFSQIREDYQLPKEEKNSTLQNIYSEIESESNGLIELIDKKIKNIDYYDLIQLYNKNLNYLSDAVNKTLFELYEDIENTIYSKLSKIQPEYLVKSSNLMKIKENLFDIAKNTITKSMRNSKDMTNEEISNYKNEMEGLLNDYSNILSEYLNKGILTEIMNNFTITKNDFNLDNLENNLKTISEKYNETYYLMNHSSFLEYPQEIFDEINNIISQDALLNNIEEIRLEINNLIGKIFNDIYAMTKDYILNFILYHKNYVLSQLSDDSILFTVEGQKEKFEKKFELITNNANSTIEELFPENLKDYGSKNNISLGEDNFKNPISTLINNYATFSSKFENEVEEFFKGTNCPSDCWTEKNSTEKEKYKNNLNLDIINNKIIYTKSFVYNIKNKFDEMNENALKELMLPEPDFDFIKENANYNASFYELKDTIIERYENISSILYNNIEKIIKSTRKNYNNYNYSEIAQEYENIINWNNKDFIQYSNEFYEKMNNSVYSIIEEYNETLFNFIKGYSYSYQNFNNFENYFKNYSNEINNIYKLIKEKINALDGSSTNEKISNDFKNYFKNNFSSIIEEKKNYFINLFKKEEIELSILNEKLNLTDYFINKINEDDFNNGINDIKNIDSSNSNLFINEIKNNINNIGEKTPTLFDNVTSYFLTFFKNNKNISFSDLKNYYIIKISSGDCWELRGELLSDIKVVDQQNYLNYLNYLEKKKYIEEKCTIDGQIVYENCVYDESDYKEVIYTNMTEKYLDCKNKGKIYKVKLMIYSSPSEFDANLKEIINKLKNVLNDCFYFERIITNYINKKYTINNFNTKTLGINMVELERENTMDNSNSKSEFLKIFSQKLHDNIINIYSNYVETQVKERFSYSKSLFELKQDVYDKYFNRYQYDADYYVNALNKIEKIPSTLKDNLTNLFVQNKAEYDLISKEKNKRIQEYINIYYNKEYVIKIKNQCINDLLKEYFITDIKIPHLIEFIDEIINAPHFNESLEYDIFDYVIRPNSLEIKSTESSGIGMSNNNDYNPAQEKINEALEKLTLFEDIDEEKDYIDSIKKFKANLTSIFEENNENNPSPSFFLEYNDYIDNIFDGDYLLNLQISLEENKEESFENKTFPQYFTKIVNETSEYFDNCYKQLDSPFRNFIDVSYNFSEYIINKLDTYINKVIDYTIIKELFYMQYPCREALCPSSLNLDDIKAEIISEIKKNLTGRNLKEKEKSKIIEEVIKTLKKEKHHTNRYKSLDFIYNEPNLNNKRRKLALNFYNFQSEAKEEKHVKAAISNLKFIVDQFVEIVYQLKENAIYFKNSFVYWTKTNNLEKISKNFNLALNESYMRFEKNNYKIIKDYLNREYNSIKNYFENVAYFISTKTEIYLKKLKDLYHYLYMVSEISSEKLYVYYKSLTFIISSKYRVVGEKYYNTHYNQIPNIFDKIGNPYTPKTEDFNKKYQHEIFYFEREVKKNHDLIKRSIKLNYETLYEIQEYIKLNEEVLEDEEEDSDIFELDEGYGDWSDALEDLSKEEINNFLGIDDDDKDNKDSKKNNGDKKSGDDKDENEKGLVDKLKDLNTQIEVDLDFAIENWTIYFQITLKLTMEFKKEFGPVFEVPFFFPFFPLFQLRLGIKFVLVFKLKFGFEITFERTKKKGFGWNIKFLYDLSFNLQFVARINAGILLDTKL